MRRVHPETNFESTTRKNTNANARTWCAVDHNQIFLAGVFFVVVIMGRKKKVGVARWPCGKIRPAKMKMKTKKMKMKKFTKKQKAAAAGDANVKKNRKGVTVWAGKSNAGTRDRFSRDTQHITLFCSDMAWEHLFTRNEGPFKVVGWLILDGC